MLPINENLTFNEYSEPNTDFTNPDGTFSSTCNVASLNSKPYKIAAFGIPFHGLHINNLIKNYTDFGSTISYTGFTFSLKDGTAPLSQAWNGTQYVYYQKKTTSTQINGYRCGDVKKIVVPGWSMTRNANGLSMDNANHLKFRDYALSSGITNFVQGREIGRDSFICSFGVGKTFLIKLNGTTGTAGVGGSATRKFLFEAHPYGVLPGAYSTTSLTVDTGTVDRANNTTSLLTINCPDSSSFVASILDVSSNGQKVLIGLCLQNNTTKDGNNVPTDNDGVDYANSYPYAICEITFVYGGTLTANYTLIANYKGGTNKTNNMYYTLSAPVDGTHENMAIGTVFWGQSNSPVSSSTVPFTNLALYFKCNDTGANSYPPSVLTSTVNGEIGWYTVKNATTDYTPETGGITNFTYAYQNLGFYGTPGTWMFTNSPTVNESYELIHACYDNSNTIRKWYFGVKKLTGGTRVKRDLSFSGSMNHEIWTPNFNNSTTTCKNAAGSVTLNITTTTITGSGFLDYILMYESAIIDSIRFANADPTRIVNTTTYNYSYTAPVNGISSILASSSSTGNVTTPDNTIKVIPTLNNITFTGFFATSSFKPFTQGNCADGYYSINAQPNGAIKILPFVKIESNKLISFNLGFKDVSVQLSNYTTGTIAITPAKIMSASYHPYKCVYKATDGSKVIPNVIDFMTGYANPALDISSDNRYCSYNPATNEVVINLNSPATFV